MTEALLSPEEACAALDAGTLSPREVLRRLNPARLSPDAPVQESGTPLEAWPDVFGAFVGMPCAGYLAFTQEQVDALVAEGKPAILVRHDNASYRIPLDSRIKGVIIPGQRLSHARHELAGLGMTGVTAQYEGFEAWTGPEAGGTLFAGAVDRAKRNTANRYSKIHVLGRAGDPVTLWPPRIYKGILDTGSVQRRQESVARLSRVAVETRTARKVPKILVNIDHAAQAVIAGKSDGMGLVRTEGILVKDCPWEDLLEILSAKECGHHWSMIISKWFSRIGPWFSRSCTEILRASGNLPVTVRLLDLGLPEILSAEQLQQFRAAFSLKDGQLWGVQLAMALESALNIYELQLDRLFRAVQNKNTGFSGPLHIMVPTVCTVEELAWARDLTREVAEKHGMQDLYGFRSMVETVAASEPVVVREIARMCKGISIGGNDLTFEVLKLSRYDRTALEAWKAANGGVDPEVELVPEVRKRIRQIVAEARYANPEIEISFCGHQATNPEAVEFLCSLGIDSLSVPSTEYHVHVARIAATRAVLLQEQEAVPVPAGQQPRAG
ncbi:MAG: hypothetical protein M3O22_03960 [Pseudomonadota bacterium]|nr:hypothetical protein [Pseudomonadota bacterium]